MNHNNAFKLSDTENKNIKNIINFLKKNKNENKKIILTYNIIKFLIYNFDMNIYVIDLNDMVFLKDGIMTAIEDLNISFEKKKKQEILHDDSLYKDFLYSNNSDFENEDWIIINIEDVFKLFYFYFEGSDKELEEIKNTIFNF